MGIIYKKAGFEDLELLVKTRTEVLKAANGLDDSVDMTEVERESRSYYEQAHNDCQHTGDPVFHTVYSARGYKESDERQEH